MKLSELVKANFEAGDYFRGCQKLSNYPELPFYPGTLSSYPVGDKTVSILASSLLPFEETCLKQNAEIGRKIYDVLRTLKFYYIVVIGAAGIEAAHVPDDVFLNEQAAKDFTMQQLAKLAQCI